jgi:hypothetical protein
MKRSVTPNGAYFNFMQMETFQNIITRKNINRLQKKQFSDLDHAQPLQILINTFTVLTVCGNICSESAAPLLNNG